MSFQRRCLLLATLVYITAAWFGIGYHAEDEFRQVVLIAEHWRGHVDLASLPLDYHAHWRTMVQPLLCAGVFEVCAACGITDPFQVTFVLRLLTAALALWVTHGFILSVRARLEPGNQQAFMLLSYFLWLVPVLGIRFTGETWSGLLFLHGLGMLLGQRQRNAWMIGAWFGAAVLFRPAAALLPLGAVAWMILMQRAERMRVLRVIAGAAIVGCIGVVIDSIVYGTPTATLWNYTIAGLTGEEAVRFTALPWYNYVLFIVKYATPPIALLLFAAFVVLLTLDRRHPLVWLLVPYLIVHGILPIKELRFLFPLAPLMPWLLVSAWEALHTRWPHAMARTIWLRVIFPFAVVNIVVLLVAIVIPAGNGRIELARTIHERFGNRSVHIDQLGDWRQWIPPFYLAPHSTERFTEKIIVDPHLNGPIHLVIAKQSLNLDRVVNLQRVTTATPPWTHRLLDWFGLEDDHDPLVLYHVTTQATGH